MPVLCEFYPGMNPLVFRALTIYELNLLMGHMRQQVERRRKEQDKARAQAKRRR
jgi:hypothetical protein